MVRSGGPAMFQPPTPPIPSTPPWSPPAAPWEVVAPQSLTLTPPWSKPADWGVPPDCRPGSEAKDGKCEPALLCPSGFQRNSKTGWCDPVHVPEYNCNPDDADDKPICGPDRYWDRAVARCVPCPCAWSKGWVVKAGGGCTFFYAGKPCCPGQPLTAPCLSDRVWNEAGECVGADLPHCAKLYGPLAKYNADTGRCDCPDGYTRSEAQRACVKNDGEAPPPDGSGSSGPSGGAVVLGLGLAAALAAGVAWAAKTYGRPSASELPRQGNPHWGSSSYLLQGTALDELAEQLGVSRDEVEAMLLENRPTTEDDDIAALARRMTVVRRQRRAAFHRRHK